MPGATRPIWPTTPSNRCAPWSCDEDRLATALARLVAEDPTVRLERRPDTGQLLLWCGGAAHAEVLLVGWLQSIRPWPCHTD